MSTQDSMFPAIQLCVTEPSQHIRLLEVPEELLDIIVKTQEKLYFKSAAPPANLKTSTEGKEGHLHLCTNKKVWAVKQVSTSNSIHVTKQCTLEDTIDHEDDTHGDEEMELDDLQGKTKSQLGISAFAKPTSILELYGLHPGTYETIAEEHLTTLVPTISSTEDITITRSSSSYSLRELFDHIPAPTSIIQRVLALKCVFELPQSKLQSMNGNTSNLDTYIPSPHLLLSTWTEIVNTAILNGKDITNIENIETLHIGRSDTEMVDDTDTPEELLTKSIHTAVSTRLFEPEGHLAALGIIKKGSPPKLDARECTCWVGNLILASTTPNLTKSVFEKDWEDRVPPDWIKYCSVEVLQPSCEVTMLEGQEIVKWLPFTLEGEGPSKNGSAQYGAIQSIATGPAPATKSKRKWHEKFAAQRDAKK